MGYPGGAAHRSRSRITTGSTRTCGPRRASEYGDTIDHMDFPYLEKVTKLNVAALAAIASAPPPPEPKVEGAREHGYDGELAADRRGSQLHRQLAADGCKPMGDRKQLRHPRRMRLAAIASDKAGQAMSAVRLICGRLEGYPRRRLGVRRLVGQQGRLRKPRRFGRPRRRVQALRRSAAGTSSSLRAERSNPENDGAAGLLRRYTPRNDEGLGKSTWPADGRAMARFRTRSTTR